MAAIFSRIRWLTRKTRSALISALVTTELRLTFIATTGRRSGSCFDARGRLRKYAAFGTRWLLSMGSCERRGALHRKNYGHVTPNLGTAERPRAPKCLRT